MYFTPQPLWTPGYCWAGRRQGRQANLTLSHPPFSRIIKFDTVVRLGMLLDTNPGFHHNYDFFFWFGVFSGLGNCRVCQLLLQDWNYKLINPFWNGHQDSRGGRRIFHVTDLASNLFPGVLHWDLIWWYERTFRNLVRFINTVPQYLLAKIALGQCCTDTLCMNVSYISHWNALNTLANGTKLFRNPFLTCQSKTED